MIEDILTKKEIETFEKYKVSKTKRFTRCEYDRLRAIRKKCEIIVSNNDLALKILLQVI